MKSIKNFFQHICITLKKNTKKIFKWKNQFKQKIQHISWSTIGPKPLIGVHSQNRENSSIWKNQVDFKSTYL